MVIDNDNPPRDRPDDDLLGFFGDAALAIGFAVLIMVGAVPCLSGGGC